MLEIACMVEIGKRPANDDRAAINDIVVTQSFQYIESEDNCLAVVCDGVGGEAYGFKAAEIVASYFSRVYGEKLDVDKLEAHIANANNEVLTAQKTDRSWAKMKTTLAGIYINGDDCIVFNIGDSRIYRYRAYLYQMSKDHSHKQEQMDLGLTPKPGTENVITRCMGSDHAKPDIVEGIGRVFDNDVYILCTDGVWGVLEADDFEHVLSQEKEIDKAAKALIELATKKESQDNQSIVIIRRVNHVG